MCGNAASSTETSDLDAFAESAKLIGHRAQGGDASPIAMVTMSVRDRPRPPVPSFRNVALLPPNHRAPGDKPTSRKRVALAIVGGLIVIGIVVAIVVLVSRHG